VEKLGKIIGHVARFGEIPDPRG